MFKIKLKKVKKKLLKFSLITLLVSSVVSLVIPCLFKIAVCVLLSLALVLSIAFIGGIAYLVCYLRNIYRKRTH